jgi:hypothetical protein
MPFDRVGFREFRWRLAVLRHPFSAPAALSWRTCASTLWPLVETRA